MLNRAAAHPGVGGSQWPRRREAGKGYEEEEEENGDFFFCVVAVVEVADVEEEEPAAAADVEPVSPCRAAETPSTPGIEPRVALVGSWEPSPRETTSSSGSAEAKGETAAAASATTAARASAAAAEPPLPLVLLCEIVRDMVVLFLRACCILKEEENCDVSFQTVYCMHAAGWGRERRKARSVRGRRG